MDKKRTLKPYEELTERQKRRRENDSESDESSLSSSSGTERIDSDARHSGNPLPISEHVDGLQQIDNSDCIEQNMLGAHSTSDDSSNSNSDDDSDEEFEETDDEEIESDEWSDIEDDEPIDPIFLAGDPVGNAADPEYDYEDENDEKEEDRELKLELRQWVVECGIPRVHVSRLLKILRKHPALSFFPADYRSFLNSMRKVEIREMGDGKYFHFGLRGGIIRSLLSSHKIDNILPSEIHLLVNIDGIPLSKSSRNQFWPILVLIRGGKNPFAAAIYEGNSKPKSAVEFLSPFINELLELIETPILIQNQTIEIKSLTLSCDAPAKSFIMCIKGHTGFYSCTKCCVKGKSHKSLKAKKGHVVFRKLNRPLRDDKSFRRQTQRLHHKVGVSSPFIRLPSAFFDSIKSDALDPMHLWDLGVTRKMSNEWISGTYPGVKLSTVKYDLLTKRFKHSRDDVPADDFARRPRSSGFEELGNFKATEFRFLRMHLLPLILRGILPDKYYNHFLGFHVATRYLSMETLCQDKDTVEFCEILLKNFVKDAAKLYGKGIVAHNFHGSIHVPKQCLQLGTIESFSAYAFENYNGKIKNVVRKGHMHLQQAVKRLNEIEMHSILMPVEDPSEWSLSERHFSGPIPDSMMSIVDIAQYQKAKFRHWNLSCNHPSNCVVLKSGAVVEIQNFVRMRSGECKIIGYQYQSVENFYEYPIESKLIGSFLVSHLSHNLNSWSFANVSVKALRFSLPPTLYSCLYRPGEVGEDHNVDEEKFFISSMNHHSAF